MKKHLAGEKGQISSCKKVPHDVRHQMQESLKKVQEKKQSEDLDEAYDDETCVKDVEQNQHCPVDQRKELASKASKVTVFVYNHMIFLSWLRRREGWKEIVRPGVTRFATTFITLKSIYDHKHDLQALVVDKQFTSHRWEHKKRSYDPIDYESIDKVEFWVVEEEAPPEFDVDDIENVIYQDNAIPIVGESHNAGDEEVGISGQPVLDSHDLQPGSGGDVGGSSANVNILDFEGVDLNEYYDNDDFY
ncbi:hypothetical protein SESBI_36715 [Sesbania bispinosa]|nr:hypothetical protein SESBI_36715 [Sesbania bispinosa]